MRAILIGILAAFFFSITFILNHAMSSKGGSWLFSASLRFIFMFPFLLMMVIWNRKGRHHIILLHIKQNFFRWLLWSSLGFVFFYVPITFVSNYSPGWLISATWQLTIISGLFTAPFFYTYIQQGQSTIKMRERIPWRSLATSSIMILGVIIVQIPHISNIELHIFLLSVIPLMIAAFCYPLGNRKMMVVVGNDLNTIERIYGMTLVTLPLWLIIFLIGVATQGLPSSNQITQTFLVAIFSGIIATTLFFYATNIVKHNQTKLAAVEATQAMEIVFTLIGEMLLLGLALPNMLSIVGIIIITLGIIIYCFLNSKINDRKIGLK
ncbi:MULTISPECIES: DMT family transporter [Staphylococcus]|uniref:DMT family transporter n=1 Tax=Staphylococcus TaxID=1279 RepID=UPI000D1C71E6|nr:MULTISPECIES: multidrug resistance efflux transporter family protein [Staphylococcus]PTE81291.1 multidrug resistance efflux transporter family protein [Staphylococcus cohnii]PTF36356.1 multidrug resistance efflux transporter family protein [Staphylococcus cohnii]